MELTERDDQIIVWKDIAGKWKQYEKMVWFEGRDIKSKSGFRDGNKKTDKVFREKKWGVGEIKFENNTD